MSTATETSVARDLRVLTGEAAAGRLAGSEGARVAASYLAAELEAAGVAPLGPSWFQPVEVRQTVLRSRPTLVVDGTPLLHRRDFSERPDLGGAGSGSGILVDGGRDDSADANGAVLLVGAGEVDVRALARAAKDAGAVAVLIGNEDGGSPRKVVYGGGEGVPVFSLSAAAFDRLKMRDGARIDFDSDFSERTVLCRNVVGTVGGSSDPGVLLTAHYDHVGDDPAGARFPGAFDNAGGVAAVLGVVRALATRPRSSSVAVAFLTGEESGLWGARSLLASDSRQAFHSVINVDGIGSEPLRAVRIGKPPAPLREVAVSVLGASGIAARDVAGRDDSIAFGAAGVPTVGLGQEPVARRLSFLHTPEDGLDAFVAEAVEDCIDITTRLAVALDRERKGAES